MLTRFRRPGRLGRVLSSAGLARWFGALVIAADDQPVLAVLLAALGVILGVWCWAPDHPGARPIELDRPPEHRLDYRIDVNRANWVEWAQLPGIGQVLARRIVADRAARGPFRSTADLRRVKGIGPKKLAAIRPYLLARPGPIQP